MYGHISFAKGVNPKIRAMGKLVFVNRYFYPDHAATSQLLTDLAFDLAEGGTVDVRVIASRQRYEDPLACLVPYEQIRGVKVRRVWTTSFGRGTLAGRAVDYLSFYVSAFYRMWCELRRGDVLIAKTDPPLISVFAAIVAKLRGATLVNWVQDLFPEVAQQLGVKAISNTASSIFKNLRNRTARAAHCNVVLGELMAERLMNEGVPHSRIKLIHNWVDDSVVPVIHDENSLRREWGLNEKFVVGYSGNLGRAHDFETILSTLELMNHRDDIVFLFIGAGAGMNKLKLKVDEKRFGNVIFKPYQPRECLSESLSVADIHLISLLPQLEGLIVPSKFYGILAVGRPVVYIGSVDGEIPMIIKREHCGFAVGIGDGCGLAEILMDLSANRELAEHMGYNSMQLFRRCYRKSLALNEWRAVLGEVESSINRCKSDRDLISETRPAAR